MPLTAWRRLSCNVIAAAQQPGALLLGVRVPRFPHTLIALCSQAYTLRLAPGTIMVQRVPWRTAAGVVVLAVALGCQAVRSGPAVS